MTIEIRPSEDFVKELEAAMIQENKKVKPIFPTKFRWMIFLGGLGLGFLIMLYTGWIIIPLGWGGIGYWLFKE